MSGFIASLLDSFYRNIYSNSHPDEIARMNNQIKSELESLNNSIKDIVENQKSKNVLFKANLFINKIFENININNNLDKFISTIDFKESSIDIHKNILIIGKTGIGKSTLVNSFLNIKDAQTGIGQSITQDFEAYISNPDCFIRLIDSKGFEGKIQQEIYNIKTYINEKLLQDEDGFIHCIWYCLTGTKFNDDDKNAINQLLNLYDYDCLPIIIVYTITTDIDEANKVLEELKNFLGGNNNKIDYIKILAKEKILGKARIKEESFGLDELKKLTLKRISKATKSSYFQSIKERIINLYKKEIDTKYKKIKEKILTMINLTQYHSIEKLNFKLYFLEALKLIFFNDNLEHNFENLLNNIKINNNDEHDNLLVENELNIINEENNNLIQNDIKIINNNQNNKNSFQDFLNELSQSYIDEFLPLIFKKFENIINKFFPKISSFEEIKRKLFKKIENKEIRSYSQLEQKMNLNEESDKFIQNYQDMFFFDESLIENDANNIDNNIINEENEEEEVTEEEPNNFIINNNESLINCNNDLKKKSKLYKINNDSILKMKDIEYKLILECLRFFSCYILDSIRDYLKEDESIINYLKNENEIISEIKRNLDVS